MSELEDLVGVWGAIDQAVVENPEKLVDDEPLVDVVGDYLGPYRERAAGWFAEFTDWTAELTGIPAGAQYPPLEEALRNLADIEPRGRQRARRLHVMAVAARVFPELREPDTDLHAAAVGALVQPGLAPDEGAGERLLELLGDNEVFPDLRAWDQLLQVAHGQELIDDVTLRQATAPPCSGSLVMVQLPGDPDPVPTLRTHFCTTDLTLERAKRFLEPSNWPGCNDFWCTMTHTSWSALGNPIYHEVVSVSCANQHAWRAEADLEFTMRNLPAGGALVNYNLSEPWQPGEMIKVDSGSLVVVERNGQVCVTTTKRVLFDHPFSGPSLSVLSCVLGYGAVAEDLVFTCAGEPDGDPNAGTEFPGIDLPMPEEDGGSMADEPPKTTAEGDPVKGIVDDAVDAAKACLDDYAKAYQSSLDKVMAKSYKADHVVQDIASMWMRFLRDGATAVNLGLRASQAAKVRQKEGTAAAAPAVPAEEE